MGSTGIGSQVYLTMLKKVEIGKGVTSIDKSAFSSCRSLRSILISKNVTNIGDSAFYNCYSLQSIVIPESVTSIGLNAFYACAAFASVVIPKSVTSIGGWAFSSCVGMKFYDFTKHTAVPTLDNTSAFKSIPSDCEIRVPADLYDEWISATNWSTYADKIVAV